MSAEGDAKKRRAAQTAVAWLQKNGIPLTGKDEGGAIIGVGTGSTVNCFIDAMGPLRQQVRAAVSSSNATTARLKAIGIDVIDLNEVNELGIYIDGADEATRGHHLIKGGGGALTREKIIAAAAARFICIADDMKLVDTLGKFPLPIEVIPMARTLVARRLTALGGRPVWRQGFVTDNGNHILDVHGLAIQDPPSLERELNQITGVVTVGLFAVRPADVLLIGTETGTDTL
jgi:ribose 5-phosphate isomerase A